VQKCALFKQCEECQDGSQEWWLTPIISAFERLKQEDHEFEASLGKVNKTLANMKP
jgi:hypothetical protein